MKTHFDIDNSIIQVWTGTYFYPVELDQIDNTAELLDFILQISKKTWSNQFAVNEFIECVDEACRLVFNTSHQGVFCPGGSLRVIDWEGRTYEPWVIL